MARIDEPLLQSATQGDRLQLAAGGSWTAPNAADLEALIDDAVARGKQFVRVELNMARVENLDTFGAWLLERLLRDCAEAGRGISVSGLPDRFRGIINEAHQSNRASEEQPHEGAIGSAVAGAERALATITQDIVLNIAMFGALVFAALRALVKPGSLRLTSVVHHLDRVCWRAVPIVLLITVLIGAIIAQQGIFHFRTFGAEVFVVDMVGILVLREVGVLIVCVMVAGRSGSAYTAELGAMKMREEIDALRTMGVDPVEVLVLPRIVALVIAVPLLTFLGSMAALYGAGLVCWLYGGMTPEIFLERLRQAIWMPTFAVGMIKAPFMALTIGLVACVEGFNVEGSASSLGLKTTASVVKSIFLVIVLDGFFAMFFAAIGM
jgi:phospholipid/cholesterol/gamma-HCH transport system permease protein